MFELPKSTTFRKFDQIRFSKISSLLRKNARQANFDQRRKCSHNRPEYVEFWFRRRNDRTPEIHHKMCRRVILSACAPLRLFGFLLAKQWHFIVQWRAWAQIEANDLLYRFTEENDLIWVCFWYVNLRFSMSVPSFWSLKIGLGDLYQKNKGENEKSSLYDRCKI